MCVCVCISIYLHMDQTAMLCTIYCLLMTTFLLLFAILYFIHMCITPSKAHAQVNSS